MDGTPVVIGNFGLSVGLLGDRAVVGCPSDYAVPFERTGSVTVFDRQPNGTWIGTEL